MLSGGRWIPFAAFALSLTNFAARCYLQNAVVSHILRHLVAGHLSFARLTLTLSLSLSLLRFLLLVTLWCRCRCHCRRRCQQFAFQFLQLCLSVWSACCTLLLLLFLQLFHVYYVDNSCRLLILLHLFTKIFIYLKKFFYFIFPF